MQFKWKFSQRLKSFVLEKVLNRFNLLSMGGDDDEGDAEGRPADLRLVYSIVYRYI